MLHAVVTDSLLLLIGGSLGVSLLILGTLVCLASPIRLGLTDGHLLSV